MGIDGTIKAGSDFLERHGITVALLTVVSTALAWNVHWQLSKQGEQNQYWQEAQSRQLVSMQDELKCEREFSRDKLLATIERNSDALRELCQELRMRSPRAAEAKP